VFLRGLTAGRTAGVERLRRRRAEPADARPQSKNASRENAGGGWRGAFRENRMARIHPRRPSRPGTSAARQWPVCNYNSRKNGKTTL